MNIPTLAIPTSHQADEAFREYRDAMRRPHLESDAWLCRVYRALTRKQRVLNIADAFRATGLDASHRPVLAFMQADQKECHVFHKWEDRGRAWQFDYRANDSWRKGKGGMKFKLPNSWFGIQAIGEGAKPAKTALPAIPPRFRPPTNKLHLYHLLWEAAWESVPVDPLLLRHLGGPFYTIVAQWDLSPAEQAVLDYQKTR